VFELIVKNVCGSSTSSNEKHDDGEDLELETGGECALVPDAFGDSPPKARNGLRDQDRQKCEHAVFRKPRTTCPIRCNAIQASGTATSSQRNPVPDDAHPEQPPSREETEIGRLTNTYQRARE